MVLRNRNTDVNDSQTICECQERYNAILFRPFLLKIKEGKKKKIPENEQKIVSSTGLDLA